MSIINETNNQYYSNPSPLDQVNNFETFNMTKNMEDARNATQTNIIPRQFNNGVFNQSLTGNPTDNFNTQTMASFNFQAPIKEYKSQLTGTVIENFGHHNMQPFFRGNKTHNVNFNNGATILEKYQGTSAILRKSKTEVKSMFDRKPNVGYVNGSPNRTEEFKNRQVQSKFKNNVLPFQQQRVGPGIDEGYTNMPSGGLNQANARDYIMPKSVDELRVKSNPKETYEGRVVNGLKSDSRGLVSKPAKNKVNTFYKNNPDRYLKNGGNLRAPAIREKFHLKCVNKNHQEYYGGLSKEVPKNSKYGAVRASRKNNYMNQTPSNLTRKDGWVINDENIKEGVADYGKSSIENKPNERDLTQKRTHTTNITTEVKKLIAPIIDIFKKTRKENFVGNNRPEGNMSVAIPSKMTVYDSDDIARTTIKETNIHNDRTGNISMAETKHQAFDYEDVPKTTIKETHIHNTQNTNMTPQQPKSVRVYDPEDVPDTTLKEILHDEEYGFIQSPETSKTGGYVTKSVRMPNTNRQFTSDYEYRGTADGDVGKGGGRGYLTSRYKAKSTNKQFTSDYEYTGAANSEDSKPMSYSAGYNARTNFTKEKLAKGRAPTKESVKLAVGEDLVNVQFKKLEADRINIREPAEQRVYQTPPTKNDCGLTISKEKLAENTQRERINPDILDSFRKNPYTQSLSSVF